MQHMLRVAHTRFPTRTDRGQPGPEVRVQSFCMSHDEDHMATHNEQNKAEQNKAADEALNGGAIVYHWGGGTVYQSGGRELTVC